MNHTERGPRPAFENGSGEFMCRNCRRMVPAVSFGTLNRNHCPYCLCSLHVDTHIGDRAAACRGIMDPIAVSIRKKGEWEIVHRCRSCGLLRINRIAGDDRETVLVALALRPLANLPFPVETLELF